MTRVGRRVAIMVLLISIGGCAARKPVPLPEATVKHESGAPEVVSRGKSQISEVSDPTSAQGSLDPGHSVYFALGSIDPDSTGLAVIRRCADTLKADERRRVTLIGMTDDLGSRTYNVAIAEQRINAVQHELRRMGISAYQIKRRNHGSEMARSRCTTDSCRSGMRRVELHCQE